MANAFDAAANFAFSVVDSSYTSSDTLIELAALDLNLSQWPDPSTAGEYNAVWWNYTTYSHPALDPNREIVRVTAITTNPTTLTITRAQEGTTATDKNLSGCNYRIAICPTAKFRTDLEAAAVNTGTSYGWLTDDHYGAVGDGTTDDHAALEHAVTDLTHIVIPYGTYRLSDSVTVPSTVTLDFKQGANFSVDTGKTLTINGEILAGNWQIFSGTGTVTLSDRAVLRWARWDGTDSDSLTILSTTTTVVESTEIDVSTTGVKTCEINHGLSTTPDISQILLTTYRSSGSNSPVLYDVYVLSVDATHIVCYVNVQASAATTNIRVQARIQT
jgi:hypothetical protein